MSPDSESKPTWLGFVRVKDLDDSIERALAAGGEVLFAPEEGVERDIAVIADPFGAPVGLMTWTFEDDEAKAEEWPQQ